MPDPADAAPADAGPGDAAPANAAPANATPADADPAATGPAGTEPHPEPDPEPQPQQPQQPQKRRRWKRALTEIAVTLLAALALSFLVRAYAFQTFWIPSASMTPTLGVYDRILVQKAFFTWHDLREGDIVVFSHPPLDRCSGPQDDLVKRVIALPGQTIYSAGNTIYIDGRPLAEPYLPQYDPLGPPIPNATSQRPFRVPPGEFYVMGDDRADSCDSRYWGPITGSSIIGKAVLDFWHNSHPNFQTFLPNVTSLPVPLLPLGQPAAVRRPASVVIACSVQARLALCTARPCSTASRAPTFPPTSGRAVACSSAATNPARAARKLARNPATSSAGSTSTIITKRSRCMPRSWETVCGTTGSRTQARCAWRPSAVRR